MIDDKYNELIQREIDGVNSRAQTRRLKSYMEGNPQAQKFYEDLLAMSVKLSKVQEIEPPRNLKINILNAIPSEKYIKKARYPVFKLSLESLLFSKRVRYAYIFAAGLIIGGLGIGLLFTSFINQETVGVSNLSGTMMRDVTTVNFQTAEKFDISETDVSGHVELSYSKKAILLEITAKTELEIEARVEYNGNDLNFLGFKEINASMNNLSVLSNSIQFSCIGDNSYLIFWDRKTSHMSPLQLKLYSAGVMITERTILNEP